MSIRSQHFLGTARVQVRHLKLDPKKHVDEERVKQLASDFNRGGCRNHDAVHAVPALVNPADLKAALTRANLSMSALFDEETRPLLQFPEEEKPHILYGDHRLRAAETLRASDRWWSVSLYDPGISAKDRVCLLQLNRDKSTALNGRDLASFLAEEDQGVLDVWTSNMSKTHRSTFSRLKNDDGGKLSLEVQGLLRFRGLQYRMCNWEPILSMRCQEEVYAYLHAMAQTWAFILGTEVQPDQLDESTVKALEMYCPAYSSDDCDAITELFGTNKVFPSVQGARERENLGRRVLSCKRIVTFTSFSQDFIYLRTCFESLRQLLPTTWKKNSSFREAFLYNWVDTMDGHEESEQRLKRRPRDFQDCYIDLWLFSMRNFPYLSDGKASQPLQDKMQVNDHTEFGGFFVTKRAQLACLASKHGFETDAIKRYKADHLTDQDRPALERPQVTCHDTPLEWKERSNRPSRARYGQYQKFLYREHVYDTSIFEQKKYATAYAIARDIVHCCWKPDIDRWLHDPEAQQRTQNPNTEDHIHASKTRRPRMRMTRPFNGHPKVDPRPRGYEEDKYRIRKQQNNQRVGKGLNDNQETYRRLMVDAETEFAVRDTHSETSQAHRKVWSGESKNFARVNSIEEEFQLQDGIMESVEDGFEDDVSDIGIVPIRPLEYIVKDRICSPPGTPRSERSNYSRDTDQFSGPIERIESELAALEDMSQSHGGWSMPEQECVSGLQGLHEAALRDHTQSPITRRAPTPSHEEIAGTTINSVVTDVTNRQRYVGEPAVANLPSAVRQKKNSSRESHRGQSGSASGSGNSGSTSWPRLHHDAPVFIQDPIYDGPAGGRGSYQALEPQGDSSSPHDGTGTMKDSSQSSSKRTTIPDDGEPHEMPNCHDTTTRNADQRHSEVDPVAIDHSGQSKAIADLRKGRTGEHQLESSSNTTIDHDGSMPLSQKEKKLRPVTRIPFIEMSAPPLDFSNENGTLFDNSGVQKDSKKRKRFLGDVKPPLKSKWQKTDGEMPHSSRD